MSKPETTTLIRELRDALRLNLESLGNSRPKKDIPALYQRHAEIEAQGHKVLTAANAYLDAPPVEEGDAKEVAESLNLHLKLYDADKNVYIDPIAVIHAYGAAQRRKALEEAIEVAYIEHRPDAHARIVRVMDVSTLAHGTKLYALIGEIDNG